MRHAASARFGRLLVLAGFGWFLTTLAESPTPWVYSTGRVAGWFVEVSLIYLILAFPTGRLPARVDRSWSRRVRRSSFCPLHADGAAGRAVSAPEPVDELRRGLPDERVHGGLERARSDRGGRAPAAGPADDRALRRRDGTRGLALPHATAVAKRALGPVLSVAIFRLVVFFTALAVRRIAPESAAASALSWLLALAVPLLALAFLVGVWRWRLFIAEAMQRVAMRLQGRHRPEDRGRAGRGVPGPSLRSCTASTRPRPLGRHRRRAEVPAPVATAGTR